MSTLLPGLETVMMPSIRKTQAERVSTTTFQFGSKRAVSDVSARVQVMSVHGEFGPLVLH